MTDETNLERRIRQRAHQIWEEEGRPHGRAHEHWEKARTLVAVEEDGGSRVAAEPEPPIEDVSTRQNLGESPTALTDEDDRRHVPAREAAERAPGETLMPPAKSTRPAKSKAARAPRKR